MNARIRLGPILRVAIHPRAGFTATVYARVRLCLQRDVIDTVSSALGGSAGHEPTGNDGTDPPLCRAIVR